MHNENKKKVVNAVQSYKQTSTEYYNSGDV